MPRFRRFVAALLVAVTSVLAVALPAQATMLSTDAALASTERDRLASALAREDVRAQLQAFGVGAADLQLRIDALSDDEVARLAGRLNDLPAGGNGIVGAIVFIFVLLLVTDILGLTKIFPFTRPVR
jgi:hypothetical protein